MGGQGQGLVAENPTEEQNRAFAACLDCRIPYLFYVAGPGCQYGNVYYLCNSM